MGNDCQKMLDNLPNVAEHCFMYVHADKGLILGNFTPNLVQSIKNAYLNKFGKPFKQVKDVGNKVVQLKPHKSLFEKDSYKEYQGLELMCVILELVEQHGFSVALTCRLTIEEGVASWFFVRNPSAPPPPPPFSQCPSDNNVVLCNNIAAIAPVHYSKVRFVNIEESLVQQLIKTIDQYWPSKVEELIDNNKLELNDEPWKTSVTASKNHARHTLLHLIMHMQQNNFALHTCINVRERDNDQLFFRRVTQQSDVPGMPPPPMPPSTPYMLVRLSGHDKFFVMSPSVPKMVDKLAEIVTKYWPKGVCEVGQEEGHDWLMVNGSLWNMHGKEELVNRLLLTQIFQELAVIGWFPVDSMTPTRTISECSSILFQNLPAARMQYFCVCPLSPDKLCVVNAPPETLAEIRQILVQNLPPASINEVALEVATQFTVPGHPIRGKYFHDSVFFNYVLLMIMDVLRAKQAWALALNVDASNYTKETSDDDDRAWRANSIWLCRPFVG